MSNKEVAKLIPVIQAFLEGKTIERKTRNWEFNKGWCDATQWEETEELKLRDTFVYRIKPEPEPEPKPSYRPFANAEECWNEMLKHQPFGWVNYNGYRINIAAVMRTAVIFTNNKGHNFLFQQVLEECTFIDKQPFGVKVEE